MNATTQKKGSNMSRWLQPTSKNMARKRPEKLLNIRPRMRSLQVRICDVQPHGSRTQTSRVGRGGFVGMDAAQGGGRLVGWLIAWLGPGGLVGCLGCLTGIPPSGPGPGCLWLALAGTGWLSRALLAGSGWLWLALAGSDWLWLALAGCCCWQLAAAGWLTGWLLRLRTC